MTISQSKSVSIFLIFIIAFVIQFIGIEQYINLYDEGIILFGAEQVFHGKVPYRDFFTMYGPGQYYLISLLYKVFGISDLVLRIYGIFIKSLIVSLSYIIVRRFTNKDAAIVATFAILCLFLEITEYGFPVFTALFFAMSSMLFFDKSYSMNNKRWLVFSGICTGLCTTFRHDLGFYNAIAVTICFFILQILNYDKKFLGSIFLVINQIYLYTVGMLIVLVPVCSLLFYAVSIHDLYQNLIYIPSKVYPLVRSLPFPRLTHLFDESGFHPSVLSVYIPFLTTILVIVVETQYLQKWKNNKKHYSSLIISSWGLLPLIAVTNLLFTLKGIVRVSNLHMVQSLVLSIILLAISSRRLNWKFRSFKQSLSSYYLSAIVFLILPPVMNGGRQFIFGLKAIVYSHDNIISQCKVPILPRLRCVSSLENYIKASKFIKNNSNENDLIYVGTGRHDKIFVNPIALYFMAERGSITKWSELHPGIQTTEKIQSTILSEMQKVPVRFVILDDNWDKTEENNASKISSNITILDDYILKNFKEVQHFGNIRILAPFKLAR